MRRHLMRSSSIYHRSHDGDAGLQRALNEGGVFEAIMDGTYALMMIYCCCTSFSMYSAYICIRLRTYGGKNAETLCGDTGPSASNLDERVASGACITAKDQRAVDCAIRSTLHCYSCRHVGIRKHVSIPPLLHRKSTGRYERNASLQSGAETCSWRRAPWRDRQTHKAGSLT